MKDKIGILIGIGIAAAVLVTLAFFVLNAGALELNEIISIGIILIIVASTLYILWDRIKNLKAGLPAQDERLKKIGYKAGYYGFIAAIWSAVGAPLLSGIIFDHELEGNYVTATVVLFAGLVFMISYLYLSARGTIE